MQTVSSDITMILYMYTYFCIFDLLFVGHVESFHLGGHPGDLILELLQHTNTIRHQTTCLLIANDALRVNMSKFAAAYTSSDSTHLHHRHMVDISERLADTK